MLAAATWPWKSTGSPAWGRKNMLRVAGALVLGSTSFRVSPNLYLAHMVSLNAAGRLAVGPTK